MTMDAFILAVPFMHGGWLTVAGTAGALASVPVIIHLLNRRRFRRVIWAAMDWLLAAQRKNARRIRIEQLLLLLIRSAIMALIALAIARPFLAALGLGGLVGQSRTLRILVIDDSYSMNYKEDETFRQALDAADRVIGAFDSNDAVAVVLAGAPARALYDKPSYLHADVRKAVSELKPSHRATDLAGAVKIVQSIIAAEKAPVGKGVYLIADRSRSAWQPAEEPAAEAAGRVAPGMNGSPVSPPARELPLPARDAAGSGQREGDAPASLQSLFEALAREAQITPILVGPTDSAVNLAVTDLTARHEVIGTSQQVRVTATISNFNTNDSSAQATGLALHLAADADRADAAIQRELAVPDIPAGKSATVEQLFQFAEPGLHTVAVELVGGGLLDADELPEDDRRLLAMQVRSRVTALLIDGEPGRQFKDSEVFGLSLALAPLTKTGAEAIEELESYTLTPRVERSLQAAPGWLAGVRLVVLANVDLLSTPDVERVAGELAGFVRGGGALMVFMGTQTNTQAQIDTYNRLFYGDGSGPLGAKLIVADGRPDDRTKGLRLDASDLTHPVLAEFRNKTEPLASARFFHYVKVELAPQTRAEVLLRYDNGDPAIVLNRFGAGTTCLVTTSADGDWNSFYGKPDYLPLFNKLAYYMAPAADLSRNLTVGQALVEPLTAEQAAAAVTLTTPADPAVGVVGTATVQLAPTPRVGPDIDRRRFVVQADDLAALGYYSLSAGGERLTFAVNPPAGREADIAVLNDAAIKDVVGKDLELLKPGDLVTRREKLAGGTEVSRTLLYAVLILCLLETLLAQRFGHFRG